MIVDRSASIYYDGAEQKYLKIPSGRDFVPNPDPVDYVIKLNEIDSPSRRLYLFLNSLFDIRDSNVSLEANQVRGMAFVGIITGATYGGINNTKIIRERFIRKHNAAAFESQHLAQRKYYDYLITRVASRSLKYAAQCGFLMGSAGLIANGSIVYRDKIYPPDWYVGFATLGALSRFMLGPKAWLFGAGMGTVVATIGIAAAKSLEWFTGMSTAQMRYLNHSVWLDRRLSIHDEIRLRSEENAIKKYSEMIEGNSGDDNF